MRRPHDDEIVPIADALAWQSAYCTGVGSRVAAEILDAVFSDLIGAGRLRSLIPSSVRFGDLYGLRVMAAVHYLALTREIPEVALHLPTLGGTPPQTPQQWSGFHASVVRALAEHPDALSASLDRTPQTNETGRAALLRAVLSRISQPVRLREIGASAGLNLRADHLPGKSALESGSMPTVVDRIGCDRAPIDPTTTEGRARLTSYIWVDDLERFERLRHAMEVAARVPATVVEMDAVDFVGSLDLQEGATTLLWHSAFWVYLRTEQRRAILDRVAELGASATQEKPFVHASWEWRADGGIPDAPFELVTRRWNGGERPIRTVVARGVSHGLPSYSVGMGVDEETLPLS